MKPKASTKWSWPSPLICSRRNSWNMNCQGCIICVPQTIIVQVTLTGSVAETQLKTWACLFWPHFISGIKNYLSALAQVSWQLAGKSLRWAGEIKTCNPSHELHLHVAHWISARLAPNMSTILQHLANFHVVHLYSKSHWKETNLSVTTVVCHRERYATENSCAVGFVCIFQYSIASQILSDVLLRKLGVFG